MIEIAYANQVPGDEIDGIIYSLLSNNINCAENNNYTHFIRMQNGWFLFGKGRD